LFLIDSWVPKYFKRQSWLRGLIGIYSLRIQLILADWHRVVSSEKSMWAFISQRTSFQRLQRLLSRFGTNRGAAVESDKEHASLETYDQWLLAYLQRVTNHYAPKPYDGAVTLLRSRLEPTGWLFQKDGGWGEFVRSGVDVQFADGNHFTMFQEPGSTQMAVHVAAALEKGAVEPAPKT
jgi:thioesterase domain-containing protein